jgi:hypothetical protein
VTRCKHQLLFRTPLRAVAGTLAHLFGPTSADGYTAKGAVSSSTVCSVAVVKAHQPKLSSLELKFSTLRLIHARIFDVLVQTLYVSATSRANTYMLCAFGQCGVLGYPNGTTTSTPTKMARDMKDYPDVREDTIKPQPLPN